MGLTFFTLQFLHAACARSFVKSTLSFSLVWTVDGRFFLTGIDMNLDGGENPSILIRGCDVVDMCDGPVFPAPQDIEADLMKGYRSKELCAQYGYAPYGIYTKDE